MELLPLVLWVILFGAIVLLAMTFNRLRKRRARQVDSIESVASNDPEPDLPHPFGYKCAWYIVETKDMKGLAQAIGLRDSRFANWRLGIDAAYADLVFVSPQVEGWTFVVGSTFGNLDVDLLADSIGSTLRKLSTRFGSAQFYATHRVVELHVWAKAVDGELVRAHGYLGETGETFWDEGQPASPETQMANVIDEDAVMLIAREWGIAPIDLKGTESEPSLGLIGTI